MLSHDPPYPDEVFLQVVNDRFRACLHTIYVVSFSVNENRRDNAQVA